LPARSLEAHDVARRELRDRSTGSQSNVTVGILRSRAGGPTRWEPDRRRRRFGSWRRGAVGQPHGRGL